MADLEEYSYRISVDDVDLSLLPAHARTVGTEAFQEEVSKLIQGDFADFGGWAQIVVSERDIQVVWRSDPHKPKPIEMAVNKLKSGDYQGAIGLLEVLRRMQPDDDAVLYNLGMALSDMGQLDRACDLLARLVELHPDHVDARTAIGVAFARQGKTEEAINALRDAVNRDPENPWAHRNLGACLLKSGAAEEAEHHLRRATELNPDDQQALYGLAQALQDRGNVKDADDLYIRVIQIDGRNPVADTARDARRKLAQESFRGRVAGGVRPDSVMYLLGAIQRFEKMTRAEIQAVAFEIAILGQQGLDTNDPAQKYQLRSLPGHYSGLHLVCLMYGGFKIITPQHDVGFDLSKEYEMAKALQQPKSGTEE